MLLSVCVFQKTALQMPAGEEKGKESIIISSISQVLEASKM